MSRQKRASRVLEKADRRIARLHSISPTLDLGKGLTVTAYASLIEDGRIKLAHYNTILSTVDKAYSSLLEAERSLDDFSEQMLMGVGTNFGKRSDEYAMAGGVRKTERRRSPRSKLKPKSETAA